MLSASLQWTSRLFHTKSGFAVLCLSGNR